jgi:hypothetical protein
MINFAKYLTEFTNIEVGQAIVAHEPTSENSSSILNPKVRVEVNHRLSVGLQDRIVSPEQGLQIIRKVLHRFGLDMPALYGAFPEGDEFSMQINQYSQDITGLHLYVLYVLQDDGTYDFYAEVVTEDDLRQISATEEEDDID